MLMIKKFFPFLIGLPAILCCGCESLIMGEGLAYSDFVTISNNSERDIVVRMSLNYPDTILPRDCIYEYYIFHPNDVHTIRRLEDENYFKINPVVQLFVYDYKTMVSTDFDTLRLNSMELKRYELSRERLEKCSSYITYP